MSHLSYAKDHQGIAEVFLRDPNRYGPLLQFIESVMVGASELTTAEREIIAAHVSKLNGCDFCLGAHKWTLAAMDVDLATVQAIEDGLDGDLTDDKMLPVLAFAGKLTKTPAAVGQSDIDALGTAGWSEQAIEDVINVVSLFNYMNRLVDAFGIEGSEGYFKQVGAAIAEQGYAPLIERALKKAAA